MDWFIKPNKAIKWTAFPSFFLWFNATLPQRKSTTKPQFMAALAVMDMENSMKSESEMVIELAKGFIQTMIDSNEKWDKAFFRFHSDVNGYGGNASYTQGSSVNLLGQFKFDGFVEKTCDKFENLKKSLAQSNKPFCVALLVIDNQYNFKILYEYNDLDKWFITKIDSDGIPRGYDINAPLSENPLKLKKWWRFW